MTSVSYTQGYPATSLPEEALRHLVKPDRTAFPEGAGAESWTRLPYPDMSISVPAGAHVWGRPEGQLGSVPSQPPPPPPPPPAAPHEAAHAAMAGGAGGLGGYTEEPGAPPAGGGGFEGGGAAARRRRRRQQQQQQQAGAVPGEAAAPGLASCSIAALAGPVVQVLRAHSSSNEQDLKRNAQFRAQASDAVQHVRQRLSEIRQQLRELDQEREAAAERGEYGTAATLRSRMDELAVQAASLESTSRAAQDQMDALAEVEGAVRQKQAGQLLWLSSEFRGLSGAAERTIRNLQEELRQLQDRLETTTEARTIIGQALSTASQSGEVRRELRGLAEAALEAEAAAAAAAAADRASNRAVLLDAAALATNLTAADSLLAAASLELALLRGQRELALQMQDYEHAERLSVSMRDLSGAQEEGAGSVVTLEKLMAAHEAVVRQRLSDFRHHLTTLERASELVQYVRELRDMYGSAEVEDREALALASKLSAALGELRASEPPQLLWSPEEAEEVVREVLA